LALHNARAALLYDVRELVRQKAMTGCAVRVILPLAEDDVVLDRECARANGSRGLCSNCAGINANSAEVMPEPRLEIRPRPVRQ
jgi:hypothetical protein